VVFEDVLELHNVLMVQRLVDLYFADKLRQSVGTFCLARLRFNEAFVIIFAASTFLFSKFVI